VRAAPTRVWEQARWIWKASKSLAQARDVYRMSSRRLTAAVKADNSSVQLLPQHHLQGSTLGNRLSAEILKTWNGALTCRCLTFLGRRRALTTETGLRAGRAGQFEHQPDRARAAETKNCRLSAIVTGTRRSRNGRRSTTFPTKISTTTKTFDKIADNPDVDVIYVVLPNGMHGEYTVRAAKAGKHVLCEKPMEISVQKCRNGGRVQGRQGNWPSATAAVLCRIIWKRYAGEAFGNLRFIHSSFGFKIGDPTQWRWKRAVAAGR
jgi:hypothetical protein